MRQLMDAADVGRTLRRLAHEIVEADGRLHSLVLLGIPTRGVPLALRLADAVGTIGGGTVPAAALDIEPYRDDLGFRPRAQAAAPTPILPVAGRSVVLVDDVLYTGRTVRAGLDAVADLGRPARVQVAVLVDRGHRELPIRADFVGKNVPTAPDERVAVRLAETDGSDGVFIEHGAGVRVRDPA